VRQFWNWTKNEEAGTEELRIDGYIAEQSWFADDVTPRQFKEQLASRGGDLTVWINSGGGECFAAAQIYNLLKEHPGKITVKIDALAASAASVIAMAGDTVLISPVALVMVHNPATELFGEVADLERGIEMLGEIKESIVTAYELKTGLSRAKIAKMMDAETWMNAKAAVKLGFADGLLYGEANDLEEAVFDRHTPAVAVAAAFHKKLKPKAPGVTAASLEQRLHLILH